MRRITITQPGKHVFELRKPGEEIAVVGIFETRNDEQLEIEVVIHHLAPHTQATTSLKGVVRGKSKLKIQAKIIIDPDCGQSGSSLTERVLVMSDQAYAEVVPDLEILTDDVRCSHAVSISNLDERQLFYLMSRGLSKKQAEELVVTGFLKSS